jgi:LuxR family maltose regulon positive regulatory protein
VSEGISADTARMVAREDLVARLDRAVSRKVTVVSAPAGSGKTSLLRAWAGGPGSAAGRVVFVPVRDAQEVVERALTELNQCGRVVLVIDDAHELDSAGTLSWLSRLLEGLPVQVRTVLATRRDLPLRLHQLRLAGDLAEIRAADLRFSERETGELLAASGVALSRAGTALLWQRTEGWAAGLRLAALSLAGHPDPERFVAEFSGSHRTVAEYLLAEMLESQSSDVQQLLLRTCLLDRVNGELADLLTGCTGSERILLGLEDANAFVVSVDAGRTWFRYHRLFADLLRLQMRRTLPDQVPVLHQRAAGWFARHGQVMEAVRHLQAAGYWPAAARLLADHSVGLTLGGHVQTVRALLRAFPPGAAADPELAVVRAAGELAHGHLDQATAHLAVARSHSETTTPERRRLRMATASAQLWLDRRRGDLTGVVDQAGFLDSKMAGRCGENVVLGSELRAAALLHLGTVEAWSQHHDAERHLRQGAALARGIGQHYLEVGCLAQLGFLTTAGGFGAARRLCQQAIELAERHGWGADPVVAPALITLADKMTWMGESDQAEHWLHTARRALQADDGPDIRLRLHMVTGTLHAGQGRRQQALAEFTAADRFAAQLVSPFALASQVTGWLLATQARLGMTGEASASLAALDGEQASSGEVANARAVIRLADGDPDGALAAVGDVLAGTAPVVGYVTLVEANLIAGLAHRELGDQRAANQAAERALALAEADRLVLPFAMTGARELLEALPRHQTAHAELLTDILGILRGAPAPDKDQSVPPQAEDLSPAELKVLRYLPTNLSRPEIASELSVSVNTISTHIRSIYAKLCADDRSGAVRRARELRLLAAGRA